jgi:acyl dehydratase
VTAPDERPLRWFDDLAVGDRFETASHRLTAEEIVAFAREWDPQPFHLDPAAARDSIFGEFVASGWHVAALMMRLMVTRGWRLAGGMIGLSIEQLAFHATRPGDELRVCGEVLELRASKSRPDRGLARTRITVRNQRDEPALEFTVTQIILRKSAA